MSFFMENDAAAAAIGEFYYGKGDVAENFLFITMGTGIGSALVLDGQVFKGSRGNALEMGHMLSRGNAGLETLVGRKGILRIMDNLISAYPEKAGDLIGKELGTHLLVDTAKTGNEVSLMVFKEVAQILSESIVSTIRILDVTDVYFGGGISAGLEFMMPTIEYNTRKFLTPYYVKDLRLKKSNPGKQRWHFRCRCTMLYGFRVVIVTSDTLLIAFILKRTLRGSFSVSNPSQSPLGSMK